MIAHHPIRRIQHALEGQSSAALLLILEAMTKLSTLQTINFGHQVAEEEGNELQNYFVETDQWKRLIQGDVDVVYGAKGAGKSAFYSLLQAREGELFDEGVVLAAAENPRGAPAFKDLESDPPTSENEFVALWKLYFVSLIHAALADYVNNKELDFVAGHLEQAGLLRENRALQSILRGVVDYVKNFFRVQALETDMELDPLTGVPNKVTGRIVFREPSTEAIKQGVVSVDLLLQKLDEACHASNLRAWVLLDRLDVAFLESSELERRAPRAISSVSRSLGVRCNAPKSLFAF